MNSSAVIDIGCSLTADLDLLHNFNAHYTAKPREVHRGNYSGYRFLNGDPKIYVIGEDDIWFGQTSRGASKIISPYDAEDYFEYKFQRVIYDSFIVESRPGYLSTGGDLTINGKLANDRSQVTVGGDLLVNGEFENIRAMEPTITTDNGSVYYSHVEWNKLKTKHKRKTDFAGSYQPAPVYQYTERDINLFGTPASFASNVQPAGLSFGPLTNPAGLNQNLFTINPAPTSRYVVETNPRLTNYRAWLSSDFMVQRMNIDPTVALKRLGDGFYEQKLVLEQIAQLTGRRYLGDYSSDEEQFRALMVAGVEFAEAFELSLGVTLSAEQMARLTSDIIWLEYVTVDTPNGPVRALAPRVYLAPGQEPLITPTGGVVSARNIEMNITGEFNNLGNLLAANKLIVTGDGDLNNGGAMAGGLISLAALRDINNLGGSIVGDNSVQLLAGGDINIASTTLTTTGGSRNRRTDLNHLASVEVRSADGELALAAEGDINLKAALVNSAGSALLQAGGDLNIAGLETGYEVKSQAGGNLIHDRVTEDVGSFIGAGGALELGAGRDINVVGSQVYSEGDIYAQAGRDISVTEGRRDYEYTTNAYSSDSGLLSSQERTIKIHRQGSEALGSELSGETVVLLTGNDFTLRGSIAAASEGLSVLTGGDINILGAENYSASDYYDVTIKSGLSGFVQGGRVGFSIGSNENGSESSQQNLWHSASLLGSENGLVSLYAGGDVSVSGSQVVAGTGDLLVNGENVTIDSQYDLYDNYSRQWTKQSGLNVSVGVAGAVGNAINAAISLAEQAKAAKQARSDRAQALYGISAARGAYDLFQSVDGAIDAVNKAAQGANSQAVAVSISASYGSSSSENVSQAHDSLAGGSRLSSGGEAIIVARGDEDGRGGDLNIIGSRVDAEGTVHLAANNDLNLLSAEEVSTYNNHNKSSSSSAGVSASIGSGGWGISVQASGSRGRGEGRGQAVNHIETVVQGGQGVEFASVNDTTLKGAQIIGEKVVGSVGGNLNIISEQDTSVQSQSQSNQSFGVSIPVYGMGGEASLSYSNQKQNAHGNYASVNEQSG
ncbi:MAG: hemagglutinin repeat-containing protein, partial [Candidatus Adiutrix sp.]|nr:hemagglutinin repeat-containing protein [Candidatus Adiutrix sp.]